MLHTGHLHQVAHHSHVRRNNWEDSIQRDKAFDGLAAKSFIRHTMKSPVVMSSTLVSRFFKMSLNTRPISFLDTFDTAHISTNHTLSLIIIRITMDIFCQCYDAVNMVHGQLADESSCRLSQQTHEFHIVCIVLIQYWSVTDTHTHTDRHTMTAYTALSIASRGKNQSSQL